MATEKSSNESKNGKDEVSKEQALFCEGICEQWVHRYCAGFSAALFKHLSTTTTHCKNVLVVVTNEYGDLNLFSQHLALNRYTEYAKCVGYLPRSIGD